MNNARDEYIVFSESQCIRCFTTDGVLKAMEEIGHCAVVKRTTTDELARVVTGHFTPAEPEDYPDDEISVRRRQREIAGRYSFAKMVHR